MPGPSRSQQIALHLGQLFPLAPQQDLKAILDHAIHSQGLRKAAPSTAAWLSATSYIRHSLTDYESMLSEGYEIEAARHFTRAEINRILRAWGSRRLIE